MRLKQLKICCSLQQSPKTASCFEIAPEVRDAISYRHSGNLEIRVNIAYGQVNPLCSCQSSIVVLIVGRRKLTLPQSGMAFSVFSIFSYFRFIIRDILTKSRR